MFYFVCFFHTLSCLSVSQTHPWLWVQVLMPALHHRSCLSWMRDPTLPQWPIAPRGVAVSVKVSSSLYPHINTPSSHRGQFSWVETCWCTAVPWVISCRATIQHMTSKFSGFFSACLILAQAEHVKQVALKGYLGIKGFFYTRCYKSFCALPVSASAMGNLLAAFSSQAHAIVCWIKPAASPSAALPHVASPSLSASLKIIEVLQFL